MVPLNRAPENWPLRAPPPQDLRWLWVEDVSAVAACRNAALALADRLQFPAARADQLGLAVTEAASNLHKHASEGSLWLAVNRDDDPPGIDLVTIDAGPGLADVDLALRDGHSTAGTLGIGLGAIRRLADFCDDLLDVAKAESGQLHTDPAHVDLAALFGRLLGLARPMAGDKPVTVTVSADGDDGNRQRRWRPGYARHDLDR